MTPSAHDTVSRTPGKRWFIAGCITLFLFSAVHMIPMFADMFVAPTAPAEIEAKRAMTAVAVDIGPFHSDWAKLNQLLSVSYSALLFFVVALNLVALSAITAAPPNTPQGRLRPIAMVNVIFVSILLATSMIYQFPPPGVFCLIAEVCFIAGAMNGRCVPHPWLAGPIAQGARDMCEMRL